MRILVQKFGGTSVRDFTCQKQVLAKVKKYLAEGWKLAVVVSARAGVTNNLIKMANEWSASPDRAELDSLMATGEQESAALFAMLCQAEGIKARSVLGFQVPIKTNDAYGKARIEFIDSEHIRALMAEYEVLVLAGFQGVDCKGRITTLGRGGSDTSAVALAAALGAEVCEIYTDVDGVYTTDPRIVPEARKLDRVTYDEMLEMAGAGAKVLQIRSVEFAKKYNVPVLVRSTFTDDPGTLVTSEVNDMESLLISGIAYDKDQAQVTVVGVFDEPGVAAKIFAPLAKARILVDMIIQNPSREGRTDMTFTLSRQDLPQALTILEAVKTEVGAKAVVTDDKVAKVSVIGVGMRNHSGVAAQAFTALKDERINIIMISTSEIKISMLIEEKYVELAVRTLHTAFELDKAPAKATC